MTTHEARRASDHPVEVPGGIVRPADPVTSTFWTPEMVAQRFHEHYERMAPAFGYKTRDASAVAWEDVPAQNKNLMLAVAACVMDDLGLPVEPPALAVCGLCPWVEMWTTRAAAEASSVWHVHDQHPDVWVDKVGARAPLPETPPSEYGERIEMPA